MKKMLLTAVLILLVQLPVLAYNPLKLEFEPMTKDDWIFQTVVITSQVIDWGQTRDIALNPDRFWEKNPTLGEHPAIGKVDQYFQTYIGGVLVLVLVAPRKLRYLIQNGVFKMQYSCINNNQAIGIKTNFKF
jgi:hypothetical protein